MIQNISAVVLVTENLTQLVEFYSKIFDCAFIKDEHDKLHTHFFTQIGNSRFIIHQHETYPQVQPRSGAAILCFSVDSLEKHLQISQQMGIKTQVRNEVFGDVADLIDPDGNHLQLVQLNRD